VTERCKSCERCLAISPKVRYRGKIFIDLTPIPEQGITLGS